MNYHKNFYYDSPNFPFYFRLVSFFVAGSVLASFSYFITQNIHNMNSKPARETQKQICAKCLLCPPRSLCPHVLIDSQQIKLGLKKQAGKKLN